MIDLSIVIPVYNEEENVPHLFEQLDAVLSKLDISFEIVCIDDGSTDNTWDRLTECARKYKNTVLVRFRRNFGQTSAMSAGFHNSTGDIIITMDADLQNDPADIPLLLKKAAEGFDVVSGWRRNRKDTFINRKLPSMMANALISKITGVPLHDYGCTLKSYRREVVDGIHLYGDMHRFIPALASWVGATVAEVEVNHNARRFGVSKYGISRTLKVLLDLTTIKFLLRYSTHPIQMFGKIGLWFGVPGLLMLVAVLMGHLSFVCCGTEFASHLIKRPFWIITPFLLILFCMQFISMALLAEIQIRTYHESQNKPIYVVKETVEPKA